VKLQAGQQLRVSKFPPEQRRAFPLVFHKGKWDVTTANKVGGIVARAEQTSLFSKVLIE
jgi:hypothetical protein